MPSREILYFDSVGKKNTSEVVDVVANRISEGDIKHLVVASSSGETARLFIDKLKDSGVKIVVVTSHAGFENEGECEMSAEVEAEIERMGVRVVRASHVLSGLERSISRKLGGASRVEAIAESLRSLFGQGMKVCVETTIMAADAGAIPCGEVEVIAVGGTGWGADTACVLRPAHANGFFNMEVREILAMPRWKRSRKKE